MRRSITAKLETRAQWVQLSAAYAAAPGSAEATRPSDLPVLPADLMQEVCNGRYPWVDAPPASSAAPATADANGSIAAQKHFARRYRSAKARADRTLEEQEYIKAEIACTHNFLNVRIGETKARLVELGGGAPTAFAMGQSALLRRTLTRWERIKAEADERIPAAE